MTKKESVVRPLVILFAAILGLPQNVCCQPSDKQAGSDDVRPIAESVLVAIRNYDVALLSKLVDPKGITLGFDSDPLSADQFKKQLSLKRGAYWLFLTSRA